MLPERAATFWGREGQQLSASIRLPDYVGPPWAGILGAVIANIWEVMKSTGPWTVCQSDQRTLLSVCLSGYSKLSVCPFLCSIFWVLKMEYLSLQVPKKLFPRNKADRVVIT